MMLDDESLLSAYLDDELDPAGRLEVESALLSDPRLAETLHELAGVRELLASLPRPELSRDLALEVGARLGSRRAARPALRAFKPAIAAAAVLMIALSLGWRWYVVQGAHQPVRRAVAATGPITTPGSPKPDPVLVENTNPGGAEVDDAPRSPKPEVGPVAAV